MEAAGFCVHKHRLRSASMPLAKPPAICRFPHVSHWKWTRHSRLPRPVWKGLNINIMLSLAVLWCYTPIDLQVEHTSLLSRVTWQSEISASVVEKSCLSYRDIIANAINRSALINRHHSSCLLGCFGCYLFKSCCCWTWRGSDMHRIFSQLSLPFLTHFCSDPFQSLLMNWRVESGVLDEGDSAGLLQDSFENHFRDMLYNILHACIVLRQL